MAGSCTLRYTAPCHAAISDLTSQLTRIISYPPPSTLPAHKTLHNYINMLRSMMALLYGKSYNVIEKQLLQFADLKMLI